MRFEFYLAKKFLFGQRYGIFRLITTAIAIGGTALGVAALLVTLAVMDGFRTDIQEKILGTQPHIVVVQPDGSMLAFEPAVMAALDTVPHVRASAPYISAQALIQTDRKVTGIMVRGIVADRESQVTPLSGILIHGRWSDLSAGGIVLGKELAASLHVRLDDKVRLIVPQEAADALGQPPRIRLYRVAGIFHSGMYEYDANLAYLSIQRAQDLLGTGPRISGYGVRLDSVDRTSRVAKDIAGRLGIGFWVRTWQDFNRPLFSAMKLERTTMFIILTLIILVSSFTIISNLLLLTIEKAREIGILQALGTSPRQVGQIFFLHGFLLGGSGVSLGLILGTAICGILKRYPIIRLPADVYYIDRLPVRLSLPMVESVAACALILVFISILYPARKARQMDPIQAIRYG